ncbi:MAG: hypothetical protein GEU90_15275 [Gemmatimonas sp.]|nr:hypothetical protein [Gemmatimonas sp.]
MTGATGRRRGGRFTDAGRGSQPVELVPGSLYAFGGTVTMDSRISWISPADSGYQPLNGYLIKEGSNALLIDTGVALHRKDVLEQLSMLIDDQTKPRVLFTRAELDATGNLIAIAARFGVEVVNAGGNVNPFDAFEEVGQVGRIAASFRVERVASGESLSIGDGRAIEVIRPPLRMLNTTWAYDPRTKTLFTSDSFGHTFLEQDRYAPVLTAERDATDYAQVRRHTCARYWWLQHAVSPRLATEMTKLYDRYDIERIAPTHGCVLEGAELVRKHQRWLNAVLHGETGESG